MKLFFANTTAVKVSRSLFLKGYQATKSVLNIATKESDQGISVNLIGLKKMSRLNHQYRDKTGPTDTISFAYNDSQKFPGENMLGEIFICLPFVKRQATKHRNSFHGELYAVFIHSLLHLYGYHHQTNRQETIMKNLTEKIITGTSENMVS